MEYTVDIRRNQKMQNLEVLAKTFADYKIIPKNCYVDNSPVRVFQRLFPDDHYAKDIERFIFYNNYERLRRGSDLPWWGKEYFSSKVGKKRVMIISQDSLAQDAGSIVFFCHLMPHIQNKEKYEIYLQQLTKILMD